MRTQKGSQGGKRISKPKQFQYSIIWAYNLSLYDWKPFNTVYTKMLLNQGFGEP